MTIKIYGTSHVSEESIEVIEEAFSEDPDVIALELDPPRLEALMFDGHGREDGDVFIRLLEKFQKYIGNRTGLMPGEEMLYAYNRAIEENLDVALIDQDIRVTVNRLKQVRRKEKVKAFGSVLLGFVLPFGEEFDLGKIPDGDKIDLMVAEMKESFPGIHQVLMQERNILMAESLMRLQEDNPESDIAAFLGAAHKNPIEEILEAEGFEVSSEGRLEEEKRRVES